MSARRRAPPVRSWEPPPKWLQGISWLVLAILLSVIIYIGPLAMYEEQEAVNGYSLLRDQCATVDMTNIEEEYSLSVARATDWCLLISEKWDPGDANRYKPIPRLLALGDFLFSITLRPLWESLFVGGADEYWETYYTQTIVAQREVVARGEIPPAFGYDHSGEIRSEDDQNPSFLAVVQEGLILQEKYGIPYEKVLSACRYDSGGFRQFEADGTVVVNHNTNGSSDWGVCQINDGVHADLIAEFGVKDSWKGGFEAGFVVMKGRQGKRQCWTEAQAQELEELKTRTLFGCYNGSGPFDLYANRVMAVYQTEFWVPLEDQLKEEAVALASSDTSQLDDSSPEGRSPVEGVWLITQGEHESTNAVDIGIVGNPCPSSSPHYNVATMKGTVTVMGGYNNSLDIDNDRYRASYLHNEEILVRSGQEVDLGDRVAVMGDTGNTTSGGSTAEVCNGLHLHYFVYDKLLGVYVDTPSWVKQKPNP